MQESGENYLEAILVLKNRHGYVRSVDVANYLSFTKPSVSRAVSILKKEGHLTMDAEGMLELTESGREIAQRIYSRHQFLCAFLQRIGVDAQTAAEDACRMEHVISEDTFHCLQQHAKKSLEQLEDKENK